MNNLFKKRSVGFYIGLSAGMVSIIVAVVYLIQSVATYQFVPAVFICLLLAGLVELPILFGIKVADIFAGIVSAGLSGLGLGLFLRDRAEWFSYMLVDPAIASNMLGDKSSMGMIASLFAIMLICVIAACVSCFFERQER